MELLWIIAATICSGLLKGVVGQTFQNQANISICAWYDFRASLIRDKIYFDGGERWVRRGLTDGTYGPPENKVDPMGQTWVLDLTVPFNTAKSNLTSLFGRLSPTDGAVNNLAPRYLRGAMLANDHKFYLYGGLLKSSDFESPPDEQRLLAYEAYQYWPLATAWKPGFLFEDLNNDLTNYITDGAAVSVPSENKAFYFSGHRGENWGMIQDPSPRPNFTSNALISVDMTKMRFPKWENSSLLGAIPGRADAELVWIPVSGSGVLIAIGGVVHPERFTPGRLSQEKQEENNRTGPGFMRTVPLYDIDSGKWYLQNTTGDHPPALAEFCSVVAAAQDGSSYNIYIYGGYSGSVKTEAPSNAVYTLSVPSFKWILTYAGKTEKGIRSHKCIKPYPDKMFVIGGRDELTPTRCVDPIRVFNLNTLEFQDTYHPEQWSEYEVPDLITAQIGGNSKGGASAIEPVSWGHDALRDLFRTKYTKAIKTYYPYPVYNSSTPNPTETPENNDSDKRGGLPKWVAPVLGVVLGLIFVTGLAVLWLLWRRRRDRTYSASEGATSDNRKRIMGWMYGMGLPTHKTNMTMASTEIGINDKHTSAAAFSDVGDSVITPPVHSGVVYSEPKAQEVGGVQVHEMQAGHVSAPLELPTEYNVAPTSSRTRVVSDASTFRSPVSPEPPSPVASPNFSPSHSIHGRNNSSLSSAAFNLSTSNPPIVEEQSSQRRGYVSGFTEDLPTPEPEPPEQTGH
ncbi:hypothetical protein AJ78_07656 [Emergomyces pasteurianus Ep9510]|uniref:Kelch repeat protein n=1 Tax=Emergomyces pasteurianus Ep9510 TaxID=1447872 RepID=A0A1J9P5D5_9EURO|nr:hypothetical protein AJ78_07656 [Emergomyces pasteurianus Ep9510]